MPDWHARLGNPSYVVVNKVVSSHNLQCFEASLDYNYIVCPLAKAHKLHFYSNHTRSSQLFDLLYVDLWIAPIQTCLEEAIDFLGLGK